ncbi:CatB-related O-acetyltransferase [Mucilaginibacter sp. UR6-11]|uniref:CatB-related O-acetyltransferase n=1 Tax=Mucilaginibacter sp. UR6-11 TaxID=1435644 RepID=UPI001E5847E8|nr:CatB-related O-acetyltransferase [Mucilaginibacter sp. UR6-11]
MKGAIVSNDSTIGEYSYIGYNSFVTKANIGRYTSIACNVSIGLGEHVVNDISTSSLFYNNSYDILTSKSCVIGNDVWIGVDSIVRRGVKIGNGAIIGANSFVNSDVPPFAVAVGTPAKVIKYRFTPAQIAAIEDSNWWDYEIDEAKNRVAKLKAEFDIEN